MISYLLVVYYHKTTTVTHVYTLSLHDALPICGDDALGARVPAHASHARHRVPPVPALRHCQAVPRSEEHTSELQSRFDIVCRLLLEKKKASDSDSNPRSLKISPRQSLP